MHRARETTLESADNKRRKPVGTDRGIGWFKLGDNPSQVGANRARLNVMGHEGDVQ